MIKYLFSVFFLSQIISLGGMETLNIVVEPCRSIEKDLVQLKNGSLRSRSFVVPTYLHLLSLQKENPQLFNKLVYLAGNRGTYWNVDERSRGALEERGLVRPSGCVSYVLPAIGDVLSSALMDENKKVSFPTQLEENHIYTLRSPFKHKNSN